MERLINAVPSLIFYDGKFIEKTMEKEAITKAEIFSTIRNSGIDQIEEVKAIVMELNGQITVVRKSNGNGNSSLDDIMS
ncbi:YetF domain-containing protein [Flavobacterium sp. CGRL2]